MTAGPAAVRGGTLAGRTVVVTAERRAEELAVALERRGAAVVHAPAITVVPHVDDAALVTGTRELIAAEPDVVVATTGVGFRGWLEAADAAGLGEPLRRVLDGAQILARGPKAQGAIQRAGLVPAWTAPSETAAEVAQMLLDQGVAGRRVAVLHHGAGDDGLERSMRDAGAEVQGLVIYGWGPAKDVAAVDLSVELVADHRVDAAVFTSAPGAHAWLQAVRRRRRLRDVVRSCSTGDLPVLASTVGPITAEPLRAVGIPAMVPERMRLGALIRDLVAALENRPAVGS